MKMSLQILDEILKQDSITINDIGFYLTVLRNNTLDGDTEIRLTDLIKRLLNDNCFKS